MNEMTGTGWLITGAGSGLGNALARTVIDRGGCVFGTARDAAALERIDVLAPGRSIGYRLDVRDDVAVSEAVVAAEEALDGIDVLVNNAGYQLTGAVEELSASELRAQFDVNVFGALAMVQSVLPHMRRRMSGMIVNISSVSGLATWAGTGGYCASKFALEALGETLAQEVGPLGIRVMQVAPGGMRTDFTGRSMARAERRIDDYADSAHESEKIIARYRGREPGDPARAAAAIVRAVCAPEPPLHLLLGADALYYYGRKAGELQKEIALWAPLAMSIAADDSD
ncbi:MAG: oxidoreductase [Woeseiaceae bacterium]|nr:oxidoreductase [Woeseiaceae bacterium]